MNYIVLDMEWNQPFYGRKMIRKPFPLYGEIVEIGAVKLNESYHIVDTFKILVTPKYYTKMHKRISKLTNIKNVDLQYGFPFDFALKQFKKWCGNEFVFLTWGPDDIGMLKSNIEIHKLSIDWLPETYDVQMIFGYEIENTHRQISLSKAIEKLNLRGFEAHDALNDARTTALICHYLNIQKDIENYEEIKAAVRKNAIECGEISLNSTKCKKLYDNRIAALEDKDVINFYYKDKDTNVHCGEILRQNCDKFISIASCDNGDSLFVRFKFRRLSNDKFVVTRSVYEVDDYHNNYYLKIKNRL